MSDSALVEAYENGTTVEYYEAGLSPRNFIGIGEIACIAASVEQEMIVCFGTMQSERPTRMKTYSWLRSCFRKAGEAWAGYDLYRSYQSLSFVNGIFSVRKCGL